MTHLLRFDDLQAIFHHSGPDQGTQDTCGKKLPLTARPLGSIKKSTLISQNPRRGAVPLWRASPVDAATSSAAGSCAIVRHQVQSTQAVARRTPYGTRLDD